MLKEAYVPMQFDAKISQDGTPHEKRVGPLVASLRKCESRIVVSFTAFTEYFQPIRFLLHA